MNKQMTIALWILQILLALYNIAGGVFLLYNYAQVTTHWAYTTLPREFWVTLGALEVLCAIGLVVPKMKGSLRNLNAFSALVLALILLSGDFLYVAYKGFPGMLWGIIPAALAIFVAVKRWK